MHRCTVDTQRGFICYCCSCLQNLQNFGWDEDEITLRLDNYMTEAYAEMAKVCTVGMHFVVFGSSVFSGTYQLSLIVRRILDN